MAKQKTLYACTECGGQAPKWQGQCPHCQEWNTLLETIVEASGSAAHRFSAMATGAGERGVVQRLSAVKAVDVPRKLTGMAEFDRVLGGGLVHGAVVLIGGDPGIGKSTLMLQALCAMSGASSVLYISGEESAQQIALRARRLALDSHDVKLLTEIEL